MKYLRQVEQKLITLKIGRAQISYKIFVSENFFFHLKDDSHSAEKNQNWDFGVCVRSAYLDRHHISPNLNFLFKITASWRKDISDLLKRPIKSENSAASRMFWYRTKFESPQIAFHLVKCAVLKKFLLSTLLLLFDCASHFSFSKKKIERVLFQLLFRLSVVSFARAVFCKTKPHRHFWYSDSFLFHSNSKFKLHYQLRRTAG